MEFLYRRLFFADGDGSFGVDGGSSGDSSGAADTGGGSGGDGAAVSDSGGGTQVETLDDLFEDQPTGKEDSAQQDDEQIDTEKKDEKTEDQSVAQFKGMVSKRVRDMIKAAPELGGVFKAHPEIQATFEATMRREAAYREFFPTVSEARMMKEQFPNGKQDVDALLSEVQEMESIDNAFLNRDNEGNYSGHSDLVKNWFEMDHEASVALLREIPKLWPQLDKESYDDVMGQIVGATLISRGVPTFLSELIEIATENDQPALVKGLNKLLAFTKGYTDAKVETEEDRRLKTERQKLNADRAKVSEGEQQRFRSEFIANAKREQTTAINAHRAIQRLMQVKSVPTAKKNEIIEKIRMSAEKALQQSPSFMRKIRAAYNAGNQDELAKLTRSAFSQAWFLNNHIRRVLEAEVPQLVKNSNNRNAQRRPASSVQSRASDNSGDRNKSPKGPYKDSAGRWYKASGVPFTTQEIMRGEHTRT